MLDLTTRRTARAATTDPPLPSRLGTTLAVAAPTAVFAVHAASYGRWIVDDAAVTFAYARSMTSGWGPVLQPGGQLVEGYSNPAWLALLAAGRGLGLFDHGSWLGVPDHVAYPKLLALLLVAVAFTAVWAIARELSHRPVLVTVAACTAAALTPSFVIWSVSGLENSLLVATATWLAALLTRAAHRGTLPQPAVAGGCGALAAVATLTRPDGAIYLLVYPAAVVVTGGASWAITRPVAVDLVAALAPVAVYEGWRRVVFGQWLPNTAVAKAQGLPGLDALVRPGYLVVYVGGLLAVWAVAVMAAAWWTAAPDRRRLLVVSWLPLAASVAAFMVLNRDWMDQHRFATPIWLLAATAAAVTAVEVRPATLLRRRALTMGLAAGLVVAGPVLWNAADEFRDTPTVPTCSVAAYAGWSVNDYAAALDVHDQAVVTPDVGGPALVSQLRIVDLAGLADHDIALAWAADDPARVRDLVFAAQPAFVDTHRGWTAQTGLLDDPRMDGYVALRRTSATDGLWVRRDLVADPARWDAVRAVDAAWFPAGSSIYDGADPRGSCRLTG